MVAFVRGTPLVATVASAEAIVGEQFLRSIEASSGTDPLSLADTLLAASDAIYDQVDALVRASGAQVSDVTNAEIYQRAVAWHFLALVVMRGWCPAPKGRDAPSHPFEWSDPFLERVRPRLAGARAAEVLPATPRVANTTRFSLFGGGAPDRGFEALPLIS